MNYCVSLYRDNLGQVLIIPNAKDENGVSVQINKPIILDKPYRALEIGEKVKECFKICEKEPLQHSKDFVKVYEILTGIKSYPKFSKDRLALVILMNIENGFTVLPLQRFADGSYRPNTEKYPEVKMDLSATNEQIGETIIDRFEALNNCDNPITNKNKR